MALTLIATLGAPNSNSYQDQTSAQAIIDTIPNASAWTLADGGAVVPGGQRDQALVYATTMLDVLKYRGMKVGTADTQALAFPRVFVPDPDGGAFDGQWTGWVGGTIYLSSTVIPRRILRAHAALTLEILRAGGADIWGADDSAAADIVREKIGPLETDYSDPRVRRLGLRRYPQVWREIWPLLEMSQPASVQRA